MFISEDSKPTNFWLREVALLLLLILAGAVIAGILSQAILFLTKVDLNLVNFDFLTADRKIMLAWNYRLLLSINHLCVFILPAILYLRLSKYHYQLWPNGLNQFKRHPAIFGILVLLAVYPIVSFSSEINQAIPLPTVLKTMEDQSNKIVQLLLFDKSMLAFITNLLIIGVLPAVGEELLFRGSIQSILSKWTARPELAIWVTAILFSAMHFQFEGFLPRLILGVVLGYLFYWSGNILYPIIAHLFNNAIQVIIYQFYKGPITDLDQLASPKVSLPALLISVVALYFLVRWYKQSLK